MSHRLPPLPPLLQRKIFKTGQTRGADDDVIYQNRVGRNSTVLIPFSSWSIDFTFPEKAFEKGYIVLVPPEIEPGELIRIGLRLGENCLYFYETRKDWEQFNPRARGYHPATSRISPLGGEYVARVPATTALTDGGRIMEGFTMSTLKGAGIRFYEYASSEVIKQTRLQLEAEYWHCIDAVESLQNAGMSRDDAILRKTEILNQCQRAGLLDYERMRQVRILNADNVTVCPLCLEPLSGLGFMSRIAQANGRAVPDLTVTEVSLFHIEELRAGLYNHRPYNLGWGHHYCNVVAKDSGITNTLRWLHQIIQHNVEAGFIIPE